MVTIITYPVHGIWCTSCRLYSNHVLSLVYVSLLGTRHLCEVYSRWNLFSASYLLLCLSLWSTSSTESWWYPRTELWLWKTGLFITNSTSVFMRCLPLFLSGLASQYGSPFLTTSRSFRSKSGLYSPNLLRNNHNTSWTNCELVWYCANSLIIVGTF